MKFLNTLIILLSCSGFLSAQNIVFSYTVDISDPSMIQAEIFARSTAGSENMAGYTIALYYNSAEVSFVSFDASAADGLGWSTTGGISESDLPASNGMIPSVHNMKYEVAVIDLNATGSTFDGTLTKIGSAVWDRTAAGDPAQGGDLYIGNTVNTPGIQYVDMNFTGFDVVVEGQLQQSLPIDLREFDVVKKGEDGAALNWVTASEENSSHFDVERSVDGKNWSKIGEVAASGNSFTDQYYQFDDSNLKAVPNADDIFYYRLRVVDLDTKFEYSDVKNIEIDRAEVTVSVYPNPTSDGIWIRSTYSEHSRSELTFTLVDITGKRILAGNLGDAREINEYISLSDKVSAGTYMLNISSATESIQSEKIVVVGR